MRRRCVLAFVLVLMATVSVVGWGPALAPAQETGGLPAVDARVKVLEKLVAAQQTALAALQSSVDSLKAADTALQNALNQEAAARAAADTGLQAALTQEASARMSRDATLQSAINQEAATRGAADQQLQALIGASGAKVFSSFKLDTFLVNGDGTVGQVGPLPAGHYVLIAKANVQNEDHTVQWLCSLHIDNIAGAFDSTDTHTFSHGALDSRAISLGHNMNVTAFTLASSGSVSMLCHTGEANSRLSWVQMVAIQVGDITTNP
jgi:hypothetical protein